MRFFDEQDERDFAWECRRDDFEPDTREGLCVECGCHTSDFPCGCVCPHTEIQEVDYDYLDRVAAGDI
jgi:hypothetical protein